MTRAGVGSFIFYHPRLCHLEYEDSVGALAHLDTLGTHAHVVRSVTIFFDFPPCADYEKSDLLYAYKKLLCSFNSFVCNFKGFCTDKVDKL